MKFLVIGDGVVDVWYLNGGTPLTRLVTAGGSGLCAQFLSDFGETYLITALEKEFVDDIKYLPQHKEIIPDQKGEIRVRYMSRDQTLLTSRQHRGRYSYSIPQIEFKPDLILNVSHGYETFISQSLVDFLNSFDCPKILATRVEPPVVENVLFYVCNEYEFNQWGKQFVVNNPDKKLIKTNGHGVTLYFDKVVKHFLVKAPEVPIEYTIGAGDLFVSQLSNLILSEKENQAIDSAAKITTKLISERVSKPYGWCTSWMKL